MERIATPHFWRIFIEERGDHETKPDIVVPVVRVVPVAVGAAHIILIIVERAAPQNAVV